MALDAAAECFYQDSVKIVVRNRPLLQRLVRAVR
jgi:hypothetical protein